MREEWNKGGGGGGKETEREKKEREKRGGKKFEAGFKPGTFCLGGGGGGVIALTTALPTKASRPHILYIHTNFHDLSVALLAVLAQPNDIVCVYVVKLLHGGQGFAP